MKTDAQIQQDVIDQLKWEPVLDGVVNLEGEVQWEFQRTMAKTAIENIAGIRRINNFITVKKKGTPANIKQKIMAAFHRSATIDADNISVEVIGSKVILTGKVRSFAERSDACVAAWSAPGITQVENMLTLPEEELIY